VSNLSQRKNDRNVSTKKKGDSTSMFVARISSDTVTTACELLLLLGCHSMKLGQHA